MRTVIALTGYARSGKDTVADILVRDHGFTKMSFAGPLKKMLRTLDPIITSALTGGEDAGCGEPDCCGEYESEALYDSETVHLSELNGYTEDDLKESYPEYRRLLQVLGTDCVRALDPDFWVNAARREILKAGLDARIIFTDCRFPNEADMIRELDCYSDFTSVVAKIHGRVQGNLEGAHVSEQHVGRMGEEWTVYNYGNLEELAGQAKLLLQYAGVNHVAETAAG